jgi:hypothetical protein
MPTTDLSPHSREILDRLQRDGLITSWREVSPDAPELPMHPTPWVGAGVWVSDCHVLAHDPSYGRELPFSVVYTEGGQAVMMSLALHGENRELPCEPMVLELGDRVTILDLVFELVRAAEGASPSLAAYVCQDCEDGAPHRLQAI